jgi:subtilisin family serine protease
VGNIWISTFLNFTTQIADYVISGASNATTDIKFGITQLGSKPAPAVAETSSRVPDRVSHGILKPDVIAPDVDILVAWLPYDFVAYVGSVPLEADYALASGTSMASPHAAGVAALVKSVQPSNLTQK